MSWLESFQVNFNKQDKTQHTFQQEGRCTSSATAMEDYGKCRAVVGRGSYGIVFLFSKEKENGIGQELYAVKRFQRRPKDTERVYMRRSTSEFCVSSALLHSNVIRMFDLFKDAKGDYCEVMEYCSGGDLHNLVRSVGKLKWQEADCCFKQLMRGVEYIHEMGVAHLDLKCENLLLTGDGILKISDFGHSECVRLGWEKDVHMVSGLRGSSLYIAPEEYADKEFDGHAVDVWACGIIYMAMITGRYFWDTAKGNEDASFLRYLKERRVQQGYSPIESLTRLYCRNTIYCMLDPNPSRRISATQVLRCEWGREIKLCKAAEGC